MPGFHRIVFAFADAAFVGAAADKAPKSPIVRFPRSPVVNQRLNIPLVGIVLVGQR